MEFINKALMSKELWLSAIAVLITAALWFAVKRVAKRYIFSSDISGRKTTNISFVVTIIKYIMIIMLVTVILQINGVNVSSLAAGLGIAGIIIGFALQDILKDLIMGTNLVMDDFFSVGDVVRYGDKTGKIIYFNIKVTKIKDIKTGGVVTVCNRNISEIERVPDYVELHVPLSYDTELQKSRDICRQICKRAEENRMIDKCEFLGTDEFCDSLIKYKLRAYGRAENYYPIKRAVLGTIQDVLLENGISIPYNKLDVYCEMTNKER